MKKQKNILELLSELIHPETKEGKKLKENIINIGKRVTQEILCDDEHKFEPRYDFKFPEFITGGGCNITIPLADKRTYMDKIYVRDVCIYCGKIIEREG